MWKRPQLQAIVEDHEESEEYWSEERRLERPEHGGWYGELREDLSAGWLSFAAYSVLSGQMHGVDRALQARQRLASAGRNSWSDLEVGTVP